MHNICNANQYSFFTGVYNVNTDATIQIEDGLMKRIIVIDIDRSLCMHDTCRERCSIKHISEGSCQSKTGLTFVKYSKKL